MVPIASSVEKPNQTRNRLPALSLPADQPQPVTRLKRLPQRRLLQKVSAKMLQPQARAIMHGQAALCQAVTSPTDACRRALPIYGRRVCGEGDPMPWHGWPRLAPSRRPWTGWGLPAAALLAPGKGAFRWRAAPVQLLSPAREPTRPLRSHSFCSRKCHLPTLPRPVRGQQAGSSCVYPCPTVTSEPHTGPGPPALSCPVAACPPPRSTALCSARTPLPLTPTAASAEPALPLGGPLAPPSVRRGKRRSSLLASQTPASPGDWDGQRRGWGGPMLTGGRGSTGLGTRVVVTAEPGSRT